MCTLFDIVELTVFRVMPLLESAETVYIHLSVNLFTFEIAMM